MSTPNISPNALIMLSMPPATPSLSGGAESMMALLFGGVNIPIPMPSIINSKIKKYKFTEEPKNDKRSVAIAHINIPRVVIILEPTLSDMAPAKGAIIAIDRGIGVKIDPVTTAL